MTQAWKITGRVAFWLSWPLLNIYLRIGRRTRVVIYNGQGEILLVKGWLSADDKWMLPGGGLHKGEAAADGAVREVYEETGVRLQPSALQHLGLKRLRSRGFRADLECFVVSVADEPILRRQRGEIVATTWVKPEQLSQATTGQDTLRIVALVAQKR